jgi:hypothetical protein
VVVGTGGNEEADGPGDEADGVEGTTAAAITTASGAACGRPVPARAGAPGRGAPASWEEGADASGEEADGAEAEGAEAEGAGLGACGPEKLGSRASGGPGWAAKAPVSTTSTDATSGPRARTRLGRRIRDGRPPASPRPPLPRPGRRTGRCRWGVMRRREAARRIRVERRGRRGVRGGTKASRGSAPPAPVVRRAVSAAVRASIRACRRGVGPVSRSSRVARTAARSARASVAEGEWGRQRSRAPVSVEAGSPAAKPRIATVSSTRRSPAPAVRSSLGAPFAARIGSAEPTTWSKPARRSVLRSGSRNRASSMGSPPPFCASVRPAENVGAGATRLEKTSHYLCLDCHRPWES